MSVMEQALREIDAQRAKNAPTAAGDPVAALMSLPLQPPQDTSRRPLIGLAVLVIGLVAGWLVTTRLALIPTAATSAPLGSAVTANAPASPNTDSLDAALAGALAARTGAGSAQADLAGEAWLVQAGHVWSAGLHDEAVRLWVQGLRGLVPSRLALLLSDHQELAAAHDLYRRWAHRWPLVVLSRAAPGDTRWLVLALPAAGDVDRAREELAAASGQPVLWATVAEWINPLAPAGTPQAHIQPVGSLDGVTPPYSPPTIAAAPTPSFSAPAVEAMTASRAPVASPAVPPERPLKPPGIGEPPRPPESTKSTQSTRSSAGSATPIEGAAAATSVSTATSSAPGKPSGAAVLVSPSQASAAENARPGSAAGDDKPVVIRQSGPEPTDAQRTAAAAQGIDHAFTGVERQLAGGDHASALESVTRLEQNVGQTWRTLYLRGVALSGLGRWSEAVTALAQAHQRNPGHLRVGIHLAVALQENGDHGPALEVLDRLSQRHPEAPEPWLNKGHSWQAQGRKADAGHAYQRFLALSAQRPDLQAQRQWVQARLGPDSHRAP